MRAKRPVRLTAIVLSMSALLMAAAPVAGANPAPIKVNVVDCVFDGGATTVQAGQPFLLDAGWAALTLRHEALFFLSQRTVASINGVPIRHADWYWHFPQKTYPFPDLPWNMSWDYPVKALAAGHSITVGYEWFLRFKVSDGVDTYPRGPVLAPLGATPTCVITAE